MTWLLWLRRIPAWAYVIVGAIVFVYAFGAIRYRDGVQDERNRQAIASARIGQEFARKVESLEAKQRRELDNVRASLQKGNADAIAERDSVIADLRNGTVRLRERFTCPASRVSTTATATGGSHATAPRGLSASDAGFFIRLASDADATARQLSACQDVIRRYAGEGAP